MRLPRRNLLRVGSVVIRVGDLERQVGFWSAALDYEPRVSDEGDLVLLRPRDGVDPDISLDRIRSELHIPPRIHLDLYTEDQPGEVSRLTALGATEVHWDKRPADADYVIMPDPEGNRFSVVGSALTQRPSRDGLPTGPDSRHLCHSILRRSPVSNFRRQRPSFERRGPRRS